MLIFSLGCSTPVIELNLESSHFNHVISALFAIMYHKRQLF